jgi:hypothetical protein
MTTCCCFVVRYSTTFLLLLLVVSTFSYSPLPTTDALIQRWHLHRSVAILRTSSSSSSTTSLRRLHRLFLVNNDDRTGGGYRFGDITRGVIGGFKNKVNDLTGKDDYKFGDLTRWLDTKAKDSVSKFTGRTDGEYQFGDITKELLRRFTHGEYSRDDLMLLLKIVATVGINWTPLARVLPLKVLVDLLNLSVEATVIQTVGEKVVSALSREIDGRMKEMVTGDRDYQLGDYTKRLISKWTGKEDGVYEFGDITKTVLSRIRNDDRSLNGYNERDGGGGGNNSSTETKTAAYTTMLDVTDVDREMMERWDEEFRSYQRQRNGLSSSSDSIEDDEYREWDEKFLKQQQEHGNDGVFN